MGAQQVGALDPALQAEDEDEAPDDHGGAEDQDAGLAQALAEEAQDAAGVDEAGDARAEAGDLAEGVEPAARDFEPGVHRDRLQVGVGRQQGLGEDVVEGEDAHEGDHHRLVDGAADAGGAAGRGHPLVAADDRDDRPEQGALDHRAPEVGDRGVGEERREEAAERLVVEELGEDAAADAEDQRVDVEQAGDQHQRQEARHDQVLDRVDAEHLQGVELLADLAGAEVGGDRGAGDAGDDDGGDEGGELADRGEDEEAAEPVERAEQGEEVGRLQARRAEAEGDGRDEQREPAELQGEEELADELLAVGIGRPDRRDHRPRGEDHHVPDLLEEGLGGREPPAYGCCCFHLSSGKAGPHRAVPAPCSESMGWTSAPPLAEC